MALNPSHRPIRLRAALALAAAALLLAPALAAQLRSSVRVEINGGQVLPALAGEPFTVAGTSDAPAGSKVLITIGEGFYATQLDERGGFTVDWPVALPEGVYTIEVAVTHPDGGQGFARQGLVVQGSGRLPRRPLLTPPIDYDAPERAAGDDFKEYTDRWRIAPPPYEINVQGNRWDPYNQNQLKGDFPVRGQDVFLVLTATSDTLLDLFSIPTPSSVSADRPGSIEFFGDDTQFLYQQNVFLSADLFKGDTAFKPFDWRFKATLVGNFNFLDTHENAVVKPDVRVGTSRSDGRFAVQELFGEFKLADLSANYDFVSLRVGVQPFSSDFRGFVFTDMNLGARLFGSLHSNRTQFNLAFFERLEKDVNSGLNTFELREQRVAIANVYRQDFIKKGFTVQASVHHYQDDATFHFDRNGILVRPDPFGSFTPHEIEATYLGVAAFGHLERINVDGALYYVFGDDSLSPLAGREVDIEGMMAALELSIDYNWYRPKVAYFYASGDDDPVDGDAEGFDAIFDNPAFAGGGFSFWNRLGIRLAATGVALIHRGSLLPDLTSSKDEGQPNYVNPGLHLASLGLDVEVTPKLKAVATANYLRFDETAPLELALFQSGIDEEIGVDLSLGAKWRPYLNQNFIVVGGVAALLPGEGFRDIYEDGSTLWTGFLNLILTF